MDKKQFISRASANLRALDARKKVHIKKQQFFIHDLEGHQAKFDIKSEDKLLQYTNDDVANILEACLAVAADAIKRGETISFEGFGSLGIKVKKATRVLHPTSGEMIDVPEKYIPYFRPGSVLTVAAKLYQCAVNEAPPPEPEPVYEEDLD